MELFINNKSGAPIYDQIYNQIKQQIISGALQPDEAMPSIRGLARDLRISVITTKRAYDELEKEGFLYAVPAKGFFVAPKNTELLREENLKKIESAPHRGCEAVRILRAEQGRAAGDAGTAVGGLNMNALELRGLTKHYKDFTLGPLDLTLPGGTICGLIGENGAGKSTTIKLILDMLQRDGGTVTILGRDNRTASVRSKEEIGVVLGSEGIPLCLNAVQAGKVMAGIYRNWDAAAYAELCQKFGLPDKKQYKDYSTGMKMKLCIAMALAHHPKLLLLDEATNGLDPVVRDEVTDLLLDFARDENHSILISSHIVSDLEKLCDTIAFLHKGRLLLCEEKDALREEYALWHGTAAQLAALDTRVYGKRVTPYGVEALVRRDAMPAGAELAPVSIEELFVLMVKGEDVQ